MDPPKQSQHQPIIKDKDLFEAAETGDSSTFQSLAPEHISKSLSLRNEDGRSLLHVAVSSRRPEVPCSFLSFSSANFFSFTLFGCRENAGKLENVFFF